MSDESLKELIKDVASTRKQASAGKDLQEMRGEYRRRCAVRFARRKKRAYTKDVPMLENPVEATRFKKPKFVTGMAPRQEKFCMEYMATGDAVTAYRAANYKVGKDKTDTMRRAYAMLNNPKIKQRIDDIRQEAIKHMAWNADKVLDRLNEIYDHSLQNGDYTNANRSVESVAKHLGMFVDRSEQKIKMGHFESGDDPLSIEKDIENLAQIAGLKLVSDNSKQDDKDIDTDESSSNVS